MSLSRFIHSCVTFPILLDCRAMNYNPDFFEAKKTKARLIFDKQKSIYCPYFKVNIILNSDGFHHLQFSARQERNKREQLLKFSLLPMALDTIRRSGTIQEYRKTLMAFGSRAKDGFRKMKYVEYWGLISIVGANQIRIKTVLRRVGDGSIIFWSVMPYLSLRDRKLSSGGIEEE